MDQAVLSDLKEVHRRGVTPILVDLFRRSRTQGPIVVFVGLRDRIAKLFDITGLSRHLRILPDLEAAVRWLESQFASS